LPAFSVAQGDVLTRSASPSPAIFVARIIHENKSKSWGAVAPAPHDFDGKIPVNNPGIKNNEAIHCADNIFILKGRQVPDRQV